MEQKTEQPTQKKKRDSAKKGQMFVSEGLVSVGCIFSVIGTAFALFDRHLVFGLFDSIIANGFTVAVEQYVALVLKHVALIIFLCVGAACACAILLSLVQTRFQLTTEVLKLDFSRLNPMSGLKEIFSLKSIKDGVKALLFLTASAICMTAFWGLYKHSLFSMPNASATGLIEIVSVLAVKLIIFFLLCVAPVIGLEAMAGYWLHIRDLRMSKHEVKQEHKETQGNPLIKGRRRDIHAELLDEQGKSDIRSSRVIIANPTHIAIAIYIHKGLEHMPFVSLIETNARALAAIKYAESVGVPVFRNIPLARGLFPYCRRYAFVPYGVVSDLAAVLAWLDEVDSLYGANDTEPPPQEERDAQAVEQTPRADETDSAADDDQDKAAPEVSA